MRVKLHASLTSNGPKPRGAIHKVIVPVWWYSSIKMHLVLPVARGSRYPAQIMTAPCKPRTNMGGNMRYHWAKVPDFKFTKPRHCCWFQGIKSESPKTGLRAMANTV